MDSKVFEEMANNIVESIVGLDGEFTVEVCRNSKKDKQMNYYETIGTIVGNSIEYTDGELQVKNEVGKITGSITHKLLVKNYDVMTVYHNGSIVGGFDVDTHNENVKDLIEKKEFLIEQLLNLPEDKREAAINNLIDSGIMTKAEETESDVE